MAWAICLYPLLMPGIWGDISQFMSCVARKVVNPWLIASLVACEFFREGQVPRGNRGARQLNNKYQLYTLKQVFFSLLYLGSVKHLLRQSVWRNSFHLWTVLDQNWFYFKCWPLFCFSGGYLGICYGFHSLFYVHSFNERLESLFQLMNSRVLNHYFPLELLPLKMILYLTITSHVTF